MGSWKPGIKDCKLGKERSNLVSATERMSTFLDIKSQRLSNLLRIEIMLIWENIIFLGFFILKFSKSETLIVLLAETKLVVLSATPSLKLHNQFGLRACEKFFTNRTVSLLSKRNLLLLRHEPSILLLIMNLISLPLRKFSNFLDHGSEWHLSLKCVVIYRNHSSILAIGEVWNKHSRLPFSFSKINREEILKKIGDF